MDDREDIVLTAERGSHLRLHVRCPECTTTGIVPTAWLGANVRCRSCGIAFVARAVHPIAPPIRAHNFKPEATDGTATRRNLLVDVLARRKTRGTAA